MRLRWPGPTWVRRGRAVGQDFGELREPVRAGGLGGRERLAGTGKDDGPVPGGGDLQAGAGVVPFQGGLGRREDPGTQQLGHGQRQFVRCVGDPGREAQRLGLAVRHGQRGGGPDLGTGAAAVVQCLQQLAFTQVPRRREHKLVQHAAGHRVDVDAQDVGVQAGQRPGDLLQRTRLVQQDRARPPQGRCGAQLPAVPERRRVQPAAQDPGCGRLRHPDHQHGGREGEDQHLGQIRQVGFHHKGVDQQLNGEHHGHIRQGQAGLGGFGHQAADFAAQISRGRDACGGLHAPRIAWGCFGGVARPFRLWEQAAA